MAFEPMQAEKVKIEKWKWDEGTNEMGIWDLNGENEMMSKKRKNGGK